MTDTVMGMVMPFLDQSESFTLGFEFGTIWKMCDKQDWPTDMMVHTKGREQYQMAAEHFNCTLAIEPTTVDEWSTITFTLKPVVNKPTLTRVK